MVHQTDRSPRKRDRRSAGLSFAPTTCDANVGELSLVGAAGNGTPLGEIQPPPPKVIRLGMYDTYQPWVLQTYGDQAKTKTITKNKYQRILQILRGDYIENESSKFKLWVKGRGFRIGPPPGYFHPTLMDTIGHSAVDYNPDKDPCPDIYVQTGTIKDSDGNDRICFKKVAIVEDFFEIVYNLHVCRDGKEQKHMGQKRTYRAVSERYAFVPREAVTKFLVLCTECPRRSVGVPVSLRNINKNIKNNNNNNNNSKSVAASTSNKINPPSLTTSMGAFTNPLGASLLGSPLLGVTLASNHPGMILNSTPTKTKNNFSSVVSLVGNGPENLEFSPTTLHMARNGAHHYSFTPSDVISSLHHSFSDKKLGLTYDTLKMTPIPYPPILQPFSTTVSATVTTPPPHVTPASPPKLVKSEPIASGPFTPDTPSDLSHYRAKRDIPKMEFDCPPIEKKKEEQKASKEEEEEEEYEEEEEEPVDYSEKLSALSTEVDFSLPITMLYMKHIKNTRKRIVIKKRRREKNNNIIKDGPIMADSEGSEDELKNNGAPPEKRFEPQRPVTEWTPYQQEQQQPLSLSKTDLPRRSPCGSPGTTERTGSGTPLESASNAEETSSNGNKDDEDDDNDDENDDEKIDAQYDPERLKAFNMFVRLFVDENLDRIVPISKQPKEKIQAIIDACARQFPEFADRTRKRIRTYLKSCRRNKRTRDSNGWENSRPTPPHLTSIQAEQILATACENEAQNAKRMRLGLDPVSQPNPLIPQAIVSQSQLNAEKPLNIVETSSPSKMESTSISGSGSAHNSALAKALERPLGEAKSVNGSSIFQTTFQNSYQKVSTIAGGGLHGQQGVPMLLPSSVAINPSPSSTSQAVGTNTTGGPPSTASMQMIPNGPTDLSLKGTASKTSNSRPSLNAVEVAAVRQLITGYRESAAFLLRSADELENLLVHQQNP